MSVKLGVIGAGYWGPNIIRNFYQIPTSEMAICCDLDEKRLTHMKNLYPNIATTTNYSDLTDDPTIDAIAVCTHVSAHHPLAKKALEAGKHVLIEKPFTAKVDEAEELVEIAKKNGCIIMVDHTFEYTAGVNKMKEIIESGLLGDVMYVNCSRLNLGIFQRDINVVWDLAPHDFSIMSHVVPKDPVAISALSTEHFGRGTEDVAFIAAHFDNGFIAHFHCNWLSPVKIRRTLISGNRKMLVWDDLAPDEKIKIYDRGVEIRNQTGVHELLVSYRSGDMYAPKISSVEALQSEARYFLECIEKNQVPFNDGEAGLKVVRMLEAADRSMKLGGEKIKL